MAKEKIPGSTRIPPERPDIYGVQTPKPQPYQQAMGQVGRVQGMQTAQAGADRDVAQSDLGHMASARDMYRGIATGETPGAAQGILDQARRGALAGQASGRGGAGLAQMGATRAMGDASMAAIPQIMQERQAALQGYAGASKDVGELGLGRAKMINEMREMQAGRDDRMRADMEQIAGALIAKGLDQQTAWMQAEAQARSNEQQLMISMYGTDVQSATQRAIAERQNAGLLDDSNWLENMSNPDWLFGENSAFQAPLRWGEAALDWYKNRAPYGEGQSQEQGVEKAPYGEAGNLSHSEALRSRGEASHLPHLVRALGEADNLSDLQASTGRIFDSPYPEQPLPPPPPSVRSMGDLSETGNLSEQEAASILPWFIRFLGETGNLSKHEAQRGKEDSSKKTEKAPFSMSASPASFPGAVGAAAYGAQGTPPVTPPPLPDPIPRPPAPGQGINPELFSTSSMMEAEQRRLRRIQDELNQGGTSSALNYLSQGMGQLPNMMGSMGGGQSGDAARRALGGAIGMGIGSSIPLVGPVAGPLLGAAGSYVAGEL